VTCDEVLAWVVGSQTSSSQLVRDLAGLKLRHHIAGNGSLLSPNIRLSLRRGRRKASTCWGSLSNAHRVNPEAVSGNAVEISG
jgi:hypothetical protein